HYQIVGAGVEHLWVLEAPHGEVTVDAASGRFGDVVGFEVGGDLVQRAVWVLLNPRGGNARTRRANSVRLLGGQPRKLLRSSSGRANIRSANSRCFLGRILHGFQ